MEHMGPHILREILFDNATLSMLTIWHKKIVAKPPCNSQMQF